MFVCYCWPMATRLCNNCFNFHSDFLSVRLNPINKLNFSIQLFFLHSKTFRWKFGHDKFENNCVSGGDTTAALFRNHFGKYWLCWISKLCHCAYLYSYLYTLPLWRELSCTAVHFILMIEKRIHTKMLIDSTPFSNKKQRCSNISIKIISQRSRICKEIQVKKCYFCLILFKVIKKCRKVKFWSIFKFYNK